MDLRRDLPNIKYTAAAGEHCIQYITGERLTAQIRPEHSEHPDHPDQSTG